MSQQSCAAGTDHEKGSKAAQKKKQKQAARVQPVDVGVVDHFRPVDISDVQVEGDILKGCSIWFANSGKMSQAERETLVAQLGGKVSCSPATACIIRCFPVTLRCHQKDLPPMQNGLIDQLSLCLVRRSLCRRSFPQAASHACVQLISCVPFVCLNILCMLLPTWPTPEHLIRISAMHNPSKLVQCRGSLYHGLQTHHLLVDINRTTSIAEDSRLRRALWAGHTELD